MMMNVTLRDHMGTRFTSPRARRRRKRPAAPGLRLLLVESNQKLSINICAYMEERGHVMDVAGDGVTGLHLAVVNQYDTIIVDIAIAGIDGLTMCRRLRRDAQKHVPVLLLAAGDTLEDKLSGFDAGADDYLVKPFDLAEMSARVTALGRRVVGIKDNVLSIADLTVNTDTLEVHRGGRIISMTPAALKLLLALVRASPRVLLRSEIESVLWGDTPPDSDCIRTHIHALRAAIDKRQSLKLLHTVHGFGYRVALPTSEIQNEKEVRRGESN